MEIFLEDFWETTYSSEDFWEIRIFLEDFWKIKIFFRGYDWRSGHSPRSQAWGFDKVCLLEIQKSIHSLFAGGFSGTCLEDIYLYIIYRTSICLESNDIASKGKTFCKYLRPRTSWAFLSSRWMTCIDKTAVKDFI